MKHITPLNIITTKRLILRPFDMNDARTMYDSWCSDDRVTKTLSFHTHQNIEETKDILKKWVDRYQCAPFYHWAIVLKESNQLIGAIGEVESEPNHERIEIGYCLAYDFWNQGLMTEALKHVSKYLFETINIHKIVITHASDNMASGKVMIKSGYALEGILKENRINKLGQRVDMYLYGMTKTAYKNTFE